MIELTINGQQHQVELPPDTPLLYVLRDHVGLTGTKFGCGAALCGACTVHLDGTAARSCVTAISDLAGVKITTIEGLDPQGRHPIQLAWIKEQVPACGYCQSGQIMQAASLLAQSPQPSDQDIVNAMDGNLCRCMQYIRIHRAIKTAAADMAKGGSHHA
jgi:aerobic-type carbon monoxide dehydrogenase small subunit (CoxS/CutS family)